MYCPKCGKKLEDGATVCDACQYPLPAVQVESAQAMQAQAAEEKKEEPRSDEFFEAPPVRPATPQGPKSFCPYCGSEAPYGANFCPVCRSSLTGTQTPPPPPPKPVKKTNVVALVGFIISLISLFIPETLLWLALAAGVASLVLGIIGVKQVGSGKGKGKGFAVTAIVLGSITIVGCLGYLADPTLYEYGSEFGDMVGKLLK